MSTVSFLPPPLPPPPTLDISSLNQILPPLPPPPPAFLFDGMLPSPPPLLPFHWFFAANFGLSCWFLHDVNIKVGEFVIGAGAVLANVLTVEFCKLNALLLFFIEYPDQETQQQKDKTADGNDFLVDWGLRWFYNGRCIFGEGGGEGSENNYKTYNMPVHYN